jgi:hypothetical protein
MLGDVGTSAAADRLLRDTENDDDGDTQDDDEDGMNRALDGPVRRQGVAVVVKVAP